jgi:hypothetical protein
MYASHYINIENVSNYFTHAHSAIPMSKSYLPYQLRWLYQMAKMFLQSRYLSFSALHRVVIVIVLFCLRCQSYDRELQRQHCKKVHRHE